MNEAVAERQALKDKVLEAALLHAAFDGWSTRTLRGAAADAGIDMATARRLFPAGGDSLLAWLDDWADRAMLAAVPPERLQKLSVRQRIVALVRGRLEVLGQHREAMRRAGIANSLPTNLMGSGRALWRTVDRMWEAAGIPGDRHDFSYYTRRLTLSGVLVSTYLFWLEDQSEGFADTWAFLDRRIEDVMRIGKARSRFDDLFGRGGKGAASPA